MAEMMKYYLMEDGGLNWQMKTCKNIRRNYYKLKFLLMVYA